MDFANDAASSSAGEALTQQQMLEFDGGGGPASWDAQLEATAPFVLPGTAARHTVNARVMLEKGRWRYWLKGPAATQVIVEDREYRSEADQTAYDFGWQRAAASRLATPLSAADTSIAVEDAGRWRAPFPTTIQGEDVYVCAIRGDAGHRHPQIVPQRGGTRL